MASKEKIEPLQQLTSRIVQTVDPEGVILFGSRARGSARPDSDYDIALIFSEREQIKSAMKRANRALWPRVFPVDLVGLTQDSVRQGRTALAREIKREGKMLYQKNGA